MKNLITIIILSLLLLVVKTGMFSQSADITIDGQFSDWLPALSNYNDAPESISGIDLLNFQVTNDEQFLFIKVTIDTEINLTDELIPHTLMVYIDADNDASTGFGVQAGYGSELGIDFSARSAFYDVVPSSSLNYVDLHMRKAPTVTSTTFEIAIGRDVIPDGVNPLFPSSTIRLLVKEWDGGDVMPNVGEVFSYTFDDTPVTPIIETEINKENPELIRVVAYNAWNNGLEAAGRVDNFENIITILNPDVIGFSESSGTSASTVKSLLDTWIPLGTVDGWYVIKDDYDMITASRWQFISSWPSLNRQFAVLIDLPSTYASDLLFTSSHLNCCNNNSARQDQADQYAAFILDAKSPGGDITLPANTPFVYAGDLNLVGYSQQLTTLISGDIQNTGVYGSAGTLDWDNSDLTDTYARQTDKKMAYTWRKDSSADYFPGRLDFIIYSDAVMNAEKTFVLQTEIMSPSRLALYGLNSYDSGDASDHFPIVADFSIPLLSDVDGDGINDNDDNCINTPNPMQEDWNSNGTGDACEDSDSDGLTDDEEINDYNTDPENPDSDNDGLSDGEEVLMYNSNPLVQDSDGDGLTDWLEINLSITNPINPDTDGDGCDDALEFNHQCPDNQCGSCPGDMDGNGLINVNDLLGFLAVFGGECE